MFSNLRKLTKAAITDYERRPRKEWVVSHCSQVRQFSVLCTFLNLIALRTAKTLWSFGHSECNRVKPKSHCIPVKLT